MDAQEVMHMTDYSKITALYVELTHGKRDLTQAEARMIQAARDVMLERCQKEDGK